MNLETTSGSFRKILENHSIYIFQYSKSLVDTDDELMLFNQFFCNIYVKYSLKLMLLIISFVDKIYLSDI